MKKLLLLLLTLLLLFSAPACTGGEEQSPPSEHGDMIAVADSYKAVLASMGEGALSGNINLTSEQCGEIMAVLAKAERCCFDYGRTLSVTNPELVRAYFDDKLNCGAVRLYEICQDGGFICHELAHTPDRDTLTLTRVTWENGESVVTYHESYDMTAFELTDGVLIYDYYWPDNPPGTAHDGHVTTHEEIILDP